MASDTYTARIIVLRKTKLGESDLILTMLSEDGSQIRAVAKGARKPSNPFSSRLEVYSVADVLLSVGQSLDIVKEARLVRGNEGLRVDIQRAAGAGAMVELLDKVTQLGLANSRLFPLTEVALAHLATCPEHKVPALTAAHLLKTLAFSGFRPSLTTCVCCGEQRSKTEVPTTVFISYGEGGMICGDCAAHADVIRVSSVLCDWVDALLLSTFDQIAEREVDLSISFELLQFCQSWIREHVGATLKSLQFMFTSGLYEQRS